MFIFHTVPPSTLQSTPRSLYLLDDPLSAVDSHVGKHMFDKVGGQAPDSLDDRSSPGHRTPGTAEAQDPGAGDTRGQLPAPGKYQTCRAVGHLRRPPVFTLQ